VAAHEEAVERLSRVREVVSGLLEDDAARGTLTHTVDSLIAGAAPSSGTAPGTTSAVDLTSAETTVIESVDTAVIAPVSVNDDAGSGAARQAGAEEGAALAGDAEDTDEERAGDPDTIDADTIDADTIDAETIDADTIDADTIDADTIDADTIDAETIDDATAGGGDADDEPSSGARPGRPAKGSTSAGRHSGKTDDGVDALKSLITRP
jgi:hypothetical protein